MKKHIQNFFFSSLWSVFSLSLAFADVVIPEVPKRDEMPDPIVFEQFVREEMLKETQDFIDKITAMTAKTKNVDLLVQLQEIGKTLHEIASNLEAFNVDLDVENKKSIAVAQQFEQVLQSLSPEELESLFNI